VPEIRFFSNENPAFLIGDRRKTDRVHIYIPEILSAGQGVAIGSPPSYEETKALLEAGWGEVEELTIEFWGGRKVSTIGTGPYKYL
jgi:hypothetical protein